MVLKIKMCGVESEESYDLQWNQKYLLGTSTENTPPSQLTSCSKFKDGSPCSPTYALSLDTPPKEPAIGWVFGSDETVCDFRLAKGNETGVSGRHFTIAYDLTVRRMKLLNLSQHHTKLYFYVPDQQFILSEFLTESCIIPPGQIFEVAAGLVEIAFEVPQRALPNSTLDRICSTYPYQPSDATPQPIFPQDGGALHRRGRRETPFCVVGVLHQRIYLANQSNHLGEGTHGVVAKAAAHKTGTVVAIKNFRYRMAAALAEIKLHIHFDHASLPPNIVKLIDYQTEPTMLMIMEYQELGDLRQQGLQKAYTFFEAVTMLMQQLLALEYLHGIHITHRDVKPDNILVASRSPRFVTKLCDFGLSTTAKTFEQPFGTPGYMAPESARGRCNHLVDIWALGIVALDCTHGYPAPVDKEIVAFARQVEQHVRALCDNNGGLLERVIRWMLNTMPLLRPSAARALKYMEDLRLIQRIPAQAAAHV
ncbi:MAG: hypothetical protein Q9183_004587 [Haloplaca sp. 2 TL-2023]